MKKSVGLTIAIAASLALVACGSERGDEGAVATSTPTGNARPKSAVSDILSCTYPVTKGEEVATILKRFGGDARKEQLAGAEGSTMPGLVLWGSDPARRVEVLLSEDAPVKAVGWRIGDGSTWRVQGVRIGDPIAKLAQVNGSPFRFYGFSWDYGGYVTDWAGGTFAAVPGGCEISVRLSPGEPDLPTALMGEGELSSDDPQIAKAAATVSEISAGFGASD